MFKCDICSKEFGNKRALGGHKSAAHTKKKCEYCGEKFAPNVLKKHQSACRQRLPEADCENCGEKHDRSYGSGRFCCEECARSYATKGKREEINEKVSESLCGKNRKRIQLTCEYCGDEFEVTKSRSDQSCCSISCASKMRWEDDDYRDNVVKHIRYRASDPDERKRLAEIGHKGVTFGESGKTDFGVEYESKLEKQCFEFLHERGIDFDPHPLIGETSKRADAYIPSEDLWLEIDGIDRSRLENREDSLNLYDRWQDKLEIYNRLGLKLLVVKSVDDMHSLVA